MPHAALCVSRPIVDPYQASAMLFQCRTQHCVCRDDKDCPEEFVRESFNAARSIVCVETGSALLAGRAPDRFQCRTQHCVCRDKGDSL